MKLKSKKQAYFIGSIASAILVCKLMNLQDPRTGGSSNPGATNVLRMHGKTPAAITLAGDLFKGLLPVLLAQVIAESHWVIAATAMAAFFGHLYPVYFGFKGGKGVATFIGVLLGCSWILGLSFVAIWLLFAKVFKISSLSALIASLLIIPLTVFLMPIDYLIANVIMVLVIFWRHRSNIENLIKGEEGKLKSDSGTD